ncbi:MAG: hypothetical protein HETSPECPRED_001373 [Heterodermia speciosa]|uniref:Uncharacterized protein n=1 Tax=Heterodermia speciosa TaxID=116794 RepID=A0A8H3EZQ2_9LECA|nr:MAG: hypothetical protein HETSPECPRED_001373 [Heterodermia speciosa]
MAPPKQASGPRKSSSFLPKTSTPPSAEKNSRAPKQTKIVHLQLPKPSLLLFPHDPIAQKSVPKKKSPLSISTSATPRDPTPPPESKSDSNEAPLPPPSVSTKVEPNLSEDPVKKESASPKPGSKREFGTGVEEPVKAKGKPGPKKKPRLDDGTIVHAKAAKGPAPGPTHKLGPKANQGAINAGLRALDRTGKPCKRWTKSGFNLKTFTGIAWEIPSWRAPKSTTVDDSGDASKSSTSSNSQSKVDKSNSNAESERSQPDDLAVSQAANSPVPVAATA